MSRSSFVVVLACGILACSRSPTEPSENDPGKPEPNSAAAPVVEPAIAPPPAPKFAVVPKEFQEKLELHHAKLELPPDYRIEVRGARGRVDFVAHPPGDAFALMYDFGAKPQDSSDLEPILVEAITAFTRNYTDGGLPGRQLVGPATKLGPELAARFGADEIIRVPFSPAPWITDAFACGVSFGMFRRDLGPMMLLVMTNDDAACKDPNGIGPESLGFSYVDRPSGE